MSLYYGGVGADHVLNPQTTSVHGICSMSFVSFCYEMELMQQISCCIQTGCCLSSDSGLPRHIDFNCLVILVQRHKPFTIYVLGLYYFPENRLDTKFKISLFSVFVQ